MERYRKRPWRLVAAVGSMTLVSFLLGRLSLVTDETRGGSLTSCAVIAAAMCTAI
jgi:hypothetical protein